MTSERGRDRYIGKVLLMIGAGIEQIPGIRRAKALGLEVVALDGNPEAPGFADADWHGVLSTYDVAGCAKFAREFSRRKRRIDGVMTLASDVPVTVSAVAAALSLPGHTLAAARRASDKLLMKRVFSQKGVAIPAFRQVRNKRDIAAFIRRHGYPAVLKPVDSRGARGVLRLTPEVDLVAALEVSRKESPTGRVMVEKFLAGPQVSTESLIFDGKIITTGLSDRNYEYLERYAPYIVENGGDLPASLTRLQRKALDRLLLQASNAIGIRRGSIKGDVVFAENDEPFIIEVAARLSGGYFATDEVPLSTGVDIVKAVIDIALGFKPNFRELTPQFHRSVCQRFFFPPCRGTVRTIRGTSVAKSIPGIERFHLYVRKGDNVRPTVNHPSRLGYVIASAPSRSEAIATAERAIQSVEFVIT